VVEAAALHPAEFLSNAAPLPQLEPPADADGGGDVPPPAAAGAGEATMPELPSPSQGGDNGAVDNMQAAAAAGDAPVAAQNATRGTDKTRGPDKQPRKSRAGKYGDKQRELWELRFAELEKYKADHGNCNVNTKKAGLGKWTQRQRNLYKNGKLPEDRVGRLTTSGFVWDLSRAPAVPWETRLEQLRQYKEANGHTNVPQSHDLLGTWVNWQRRCNKSGKLSDERRALLAGIGFDFGATKVKSVDRVAELRQYKEEHGNTNVPRRHARLGKFVDNCRSLKRRGKLSKAVVDSLNEMGFEWTSKKNGQQVWAQRFEELKEYKEKYGNTRVPVRYPENPLLGQWVVDQKNVAKKKGNRTLSEEKLEKLRSINFDFGKERRRNKPWDERLADYLAYVAQHGEGATPSGNTDLGRWVTKQRHMWGRGNISEEQVRRLEAAGFPFNLRTERLNKPADGGLKIPAADDEDGGGEAGGMGRQHGDLVLSLEDQVDLTLTISPGRLGLTLQVDAVGGAVVTSVDPACTFGNQVDVGDRLILIDGRPVESADDLYTGSDRVRIFGFAKRQEGDLDPTHRQTAGETARKCNFVKGPNHLLQENLAQV